MFREGVVLRLRAWSRADTQEAPSEHLLSKCLGRPGSTLAWSKGPGGTCVALTGVAGSVHPSLPLSSAKSPRWEAPSLEDSQSAPCAGGLDHYRSSPSPS